MQKDFALWLVPSEPEASLLQAWIEKLAGYFGSIAFPPHVTLVGRLTQPQAQVVTKTQALSAYLPPFRVTLQDYGWQNTYFRCFYLEVADTLAMKLAQKAIKKHFGVKHALFKPHLSLVYGHLQNEIKEHLAKKLSTLGKVCMKFEAIRLVTMSQDHDPKTWRPAHLFRLGPSRKHRPRNILATRKARYATHRRIPAEGSCSAILPWLAEVSDGGDNAEIPLKTE